jgi:hypothetical protein
MNSEKINICTVTLGADADIVNENLIEFNRLYNDVKLYIVCPKNDVDIFKDTLTEKNYEIIKEDELIKFKDFKNIFEELSKNLEYKEEFRNRLQWYYALFLKFFFIHKFFENNDSKIVIWEGDSVILKKIKFFKNDTSLLYVWVHYYHDIFYKTCKEMLGNLPRYYGSFITMFGSITKNEFDYLNKSLGFTKLSNKEFCTAFSQKVFTSIFKAHKVYDNAMFSDYDTIGISNQNKNFTKQKPIFFLRSSLDGKLTKFQKIIAKTFGAHLVAYEHRHPNNHSKGMLLRNQTWYRFVKIIIYYYSLFKFYQIKFNVKYYL